MRRLAFSVLAASSLALLTACGQGGTAFGGGSSGNASSVILTSAQGLSGVFAVRQGAAIIVNATAVAGTQNVVTTDQNFTFAWSLAPAGSIYQTGSVSGAEQAPCGALPTGAGGPPLPTVLTNAGANFVTVTAPANATPYAFSASVVLGSTTAATEPYCLHVVATHTIDGVQGSANIPVLP
jgi:hypothetical protein